MPPEILWSFILSIWRMAYEAKVGGQVLNLSAETICLLVAKLPDFYEDAFLEAVSRVEFEAMTLLAPNAAARAVGYFQMRPKGVRFATMLSPDCQILMAVHSFIFATFWHEVMNAGTVARLLEPGCIEARAAQLGPSLTYFAAEPRLAARLVRCDVWQHVQLINTGT